MGSVILYTLLAGICLSASLLRCVESLPLPTTTESPPNSPAISSGADTEEATAESSSEIPDQTIVPSFHQDTPGSLASHVYAILTIFNQPTPSPDFERVTEDPNLPVSSAVVSSSTTILSEENCSSKIVERGPCRKRSASTDELAEVVFSYMTRNVKRSLREANPSAASTSNWHLPNVGELPTDETSSDSADSRQRDSGSSPSADSNEATASSADSNEATASSADSNEATASFANSNEDTTSLANSNEATASSGDSNEATSSSRDSLSASTQKTTRM